MSDNYKLIKSYQEKKKPIKITIKGVGTLGIILVVLKILGISSLNWFWTTLPFTFPFVLIISFLLVVGFILAILAILDAIF